MQNTTSAQRALYQRIIDNIPATTESDLAMRDHVGAFDRSAWKTCGALGLCGLTVPKELGGSGLDPVSAVIAMEAFGRGCNDNGLGLSLGAHLWGCLTVLTSTKSNQNTALIRDLASGQIIGALAVTEPNAGSDISAIETTAVAVDGGYRLNGRKCFITNAPVADVLVVLAATDNNKSSFSLSAFCLQRGMSGLGTGDPVSKMGMRTAPMGDVVLEDCFVPTTARIGAEGAGLSLFLKAMETERAFILAPAIGAMERTIDSTVSYALSREQSGRPIAEFEPVHTRIAEMHRRMVLSRLILRQAAAQKTAGKSFAMEAAMTKLTVSDAWVANCQDALAVFAGMGYLSDTGVERELRDAHGSQIYSGTAEIQRRTIARFLKVIS